MNILFGFAKNIIVVNYKPNSLGSSRKMQQPERVNSLNFQILIPVWGYKYIERFFAFCTTNLFNTENIQLLAKFKSAEVVILTTEECAPIIRLIEKLYPIKFKLIYIDDLIPLKSYGMILTFAYTRGIMAAGKDQVNTAFMLLNADFVLSDGTIQALKDALNAGYNGVLCPSMRCIEDDCKSSLEQLTARSARKLVELCINNMHPTMAANFIDQQAVYNKKNLAVHKRISSSAIATISYNPFMLCIKPEIEYSGARGYCDFNFVPAMIPSDNYHFVTDSDEIFILELSDLKQEEDFIEFYPQQECYQIEWMCEILMKPRLKYCNYVHIMHTEDLDLTAAQPGKTALSDYVQNILGKIPADYFDKYSLHDFHYFWTTPLIQYFKKGFISAELPELATILLGAEKDRAVEHEKQRRLEVKKFNIPYVNHPLQSFKSVLQYQDPNLLLITDSSTKLSQHASRNLLDVIGTKQPFDANDNKVKNILFCISRSAFDFYRNAIKEFIDVNKNKYHISLLIPYSGNEPLQSITYIMAIVNFLGVNLKEVTTVRNYSSNRIYGISEVREYSLSYVMYGIIRRISFNIGKYYNLLRFALLDVFRFVWKYVQTYSVKLSLRWKHNSLINILRNPWVKSLDLNRRTIFIEVDSIDSR